MNLWKPIETAPKDGIPILVGCWEPHYLWNQPIKTFDRKPDRWQAITVYWQPVERAWNLVEAGNFAESDVPEFEPTHWTEIPTPPPQQQAQ